MALGMTKFPEGDNPMGNWREFYGFNVDPFTGQSQRYTAGPLHGTMAPVIEGSDTGFGGGDLRRAFKAGHSAHSIMKYLKGESMTGSGLFKEQGGTAIGQEAINDLRAQLSIEQGMKNMFHSYKNQKAAFDDLSSKYDDLASQQSTNTGNIATNTGGIQDNQALANQVTVTGPSAVTGGSALQIQQSGAGSGLGTLTAGLAGLSRTSDQSLKNKTLNI